MDDKRCGTCRHATPAEMRPHWYDCDALIPESAWGAERAPMLQDDGVDCPCWQDKETDHA